MLNELEQFYLKQEEPNRSCLLAMRQWVLQHYPHFTETRKYGMPCFCYYNKACCYLWTDKKTNEPYILMVEGNYLKHSQLESGDRARMKILRINPNNDLPIATIKAVLDEAIMLYENGTISIKKK